MNRIIWSVIIFIFICVGFMLQKYCAWDDAEHFTVQMGLEEEIMSLYSEILQRSPSSVELISASRDISSGKLTTDGLRQRLMDSDEYARIIKLQSNSLTPELPKIIADKELLHKIIAIYREEKKLPVPNEAILPLKDVYIWLNYNEYAFRAFLQDTAYPNFESDVLRNDTLDAVILKEMVEKTFEKKDLEEAGVAIAETIAKQKAALTASNLDGSGIATSAGTVGDGGVSGVSSQDSTMRTVVDQDSDMTPMVNGIMTNADRIFNKDQYGRLLDLQIEEGRIPVQLHYGQMALRPDMSWSVPQRPAPVCTTLGQKPLVQPVMTNSPLLLGTSLDDAEDTEVGSIMPKFEFKEYVPIMIQKTDPVTSAAPATAANPMPATA
jgi:hypothetical protein